MVSSVEVPEVDVVVEDIVVEDVVSGLHFKNPRGHTKKVPVVVNGAQKLSTSGFSSAPMPKLLSALSSSPSYSARHSPNVPSMQLVHA
jgi:hypothetical protein